jgi:catalase (peroxidase I)
LAAGTLSGCCRVGASPIKPDAGRAEIIASMVRLAFHDASPFSVFDASSSGPNGCIDFNTSDNNGLQTIVATMATLQSTVQTMYNITISLADLYQFSANVAV